MSEIKVFNKVNKTTNSLTTFKFGETEISLDEHDLNSFVKLLYTQRPDLFENLAVIVDNEKKIQSLENDVDELKRDLWYAQSRIEELENQSSDGDDYDDYE